MIIANLYGAKSKLPFFRQTFGCSGRYRDVQFDINNMDAEWQVVSAPMPDLSPLAGKKILYVQNEPPEYYLPSLENLRKCAAVLTPLQFDAPGLLQFLAPASVQWMYGLRCENRPGVGMWFDENGFLSLEELMTAHKPEKKYICSIIVSAKTFLPGHRARLDFVQKLLTYFGDRIDFYGFGFRPIADKRDAIDPYLFSIGMENAVHDNCISEKLTDVYLGYTMPIYYGAPNVTEYFPKESLLQFDFADSERAIAQIDALLSNPMANYNAQAVADARRRVLLDYNCFDLTARALEQAELRLQSQNTAVAVVE